jgi:hypothetical protein
MVIVHTDEGIHINNGRDIHEGLDISSVSVCTGDYTTHTIQAPKDSIIKRKNNVITIRVITHRKT